VWRRTAGQSPETVRVADLELDLVRQRASRGGRRLDLTPKEFAIVALLARQPGEPLSRAVLAAEVWGMRYEAESNFVDVHVRRLRSKVDDPFEHKLIHTVRGVGYVFQQPA
jgi:two-component system copper resistance phosphate regulon response regulator CusR